MGRGDAVPETGAAGPGARRARRLGRGGRVLGTVEGNDNAGVVAIGAHEAANLCCDREAVAHLHALAMQG